MRKGQRKEDGECDPFNAASASLTNQLKNELYYKLTCQGMHLRIKWIALGL